MNDIIVGVDRSDTARKAAETAASMAAKSDANLHLVMCVKRGSTHAVNVGGDSFHIDWLSEAEAFLHGLRGTLPHDEITCTVSLDSPATAMCEEATRLEARTIVVGNRRVQGVTRVLGSVAADVTQHAPCDVLIANTTEA
jgi:nucleotide-binding universal stress UspA family protein